MHEFGRLIVMACQIALQGEINLAAALIYTYIAINTLAMCIYRHDSVNILEYKADF